MYSYIVFLTYILIASSARAFSIGNEFPIGTIISWKPSNELNLPIPCGWELCNGQAVEDSMSPIFGYQLPPINTENFFLRGTAKEDEVGKIQDDAIPEHGHETMGHTHQDSGHTHLDNGHDHNSKVKIPFPVLQQGVEKGDGNGSPKWATSGHYPPFKGDSLKSSKANLLSGTSQISEGYTRLSGVVNARVAHETRPKNVKYPYIMKINDGNCNGGNDQFASIVGWLPQEPYLRLKNWNESTYLNDIKVFLRGGTVDTIGEFEMDSMQDHSHRDLGHGHLDQGHTHEDLGHIHDIESTDGITYDVLRPGGFWGDGDGGPHFGEKIDMDPFFKKGYADIQMSHANIEISKEIVEQVIDTPTGSETRPDNIHVVWIEGKTTMMPDDFPVGSIVAWLPMIHNHKEANIPLGWLECNGEDGKTPDINGQKLFLRGAHVESAGKFEDFQLQDHTHNDLGHTHTDAGHTHVDLGHNLGHYDILIPGTDYGDEDGGGHFAQEAIIDIGKSNPSKANLKSSNANLDVSKALIKDVVDAKTSEEARPKNIAIKFIMKVY